MIAPSSIQCDLCVIGSGMAGLSAAFFAARKGIRTVMAGRTGEILFATGLFDLMAVHPLETGEIWDDPWACIAQLSNDLPQHPYARIPPDRIRSAFDALIAFLEGAGMPYTGLPERNSQVLTSIGTFKPTYRLPVTMWNGIDVCRRKTPCLLVDFRGLKGFSAVQIAAMIGAGWPALHTLRIDFPNAARSGELFPERLALTLETAEGREELAAAIQPRLKDAEAVGLPAILGLSDPQAVMVDLQRRLKVRVFEIPTMPPGVTGLRLKDAFERGLRDLGVGLLLENRIFRAEADPRGGFRLHAGRTEVEAVIEARSVILATGRFLGGGLTADRQMVKESLFDLPVHQPERRDQWHREDFLDRRGHPVNRAGLETDRHFRPLDRSGRPAHPRLFAAGSILAHQDWVRMKCGSGLAVATAWVAVEGAGEMFREPLASPG